MNPAKIIVGLILLVIIVVIFGGAVYLIQYLHADGGVATSLLSGLASLLSRSFIAFIAVLGLLILAAWLLWSGTDREKVK